MYVFGYHCYPFGTEIFGVIDIYEKRIALKS
jgi:hypothetical protein